MDRRPILDHDEKFRPHGVDWGTFDEIAEEAAQKIRTARGALPPSQRPLFDAWLLRKIR